MAQRQRIASQSRRVRTGGKRRCERSMSALATCSYTDASVVRLDNGERFGWWKDKTLARVRYRSGSSLERWAPAFQGLDHGPAGQSYYNINSNIYIASTLPAVKRKHLVDRVQRAGCCQLLPKLLFIFTFCYAVLSTLMGNLNGSRPNTTRLHWEKQALASMTRQDRLWPSIGSTLPV